jgi:hypothetical protein
MGAALHEVSNALTVIVGWLVRARELRHDPDEVAHALDVATDRASQARTIVRRAIGAEVEREREATVGDLVEDLVNGLDPEFRRASIKALVSVPDSVRGLLLENASKVVQILTTSS